MFRRRHSLFAPMIALSLTTACLMPARVQVDRLDADTSTDLSGRWNDTDARLVAEQMIRDALAHPWSDEARARLQRRPVVVVQAIRNRSLEHIDTSIFVQQLQRALIDSGRVDFVASAAERQELREERRDQDLNASDETRKEMGGEIGADYALGGEISATLDRQKGTSIMSYQVTLKLIDLATNRIAWTSLKKIKKRVQRAEMTW